MKHTPAILLSLLLASTLTAQGHRFALPIHPGGAPMKWSLQTLFGTASGDPNFNAVGHIGVRTYNPRAPFGRAQFEPVPVHVGDVTTDPESLYAFVPNPIPGGPHLIELWANDMDFSVTSYDFAVDHSGYFQTLAVLFFNDGEIEVFSFGVTTTLPLVNISSDPFNVSGILREVGGSILLDTDFDISISDTLGGISVAATVVGPLRALETLVSYDPVLTVPPLIGGQAASITLTGAQSSETTYLLYSVVGPGSTWVPHMFAHLDLAAPRIGTTVVSDASGNATWNTAIPPMPGLQVWLQSMQLGCVSNLVATTIQ